MKLEQSFEVEAPIDVVWRALIDVERVAPCLPGASVTGRNEDGSYAGALTIKIGPTTAAYAGRLEMEQIDESAHTATMQAQGTDKRGQGGAKATITSKLSQSGQATRVDVLTDYHITGRLARFGRGGMIEDISNRLLRDFAACLQKSLARGGAAAAPAPGVANGDGSAPTAAPAADEATPVPTEAAEAETVVTAAAAGAPLPPPAEPGAAGAGSGQPAHEHHHEHHEHHVADAINGIELVASVMWERTRRNPLPVAVVLGFLLALVTLRRRRH